MSPLLDGPDTPPLSPVHEHEIVARAEEHDGLGHVSNIVYVRWIQDAAVAHSVAAGWNEEAYRRLGAVFVVRRHEVEYLLPTYAGDRLTARTWIARWTAATSERRTMIERAGDGRAVVRAATVWALVSLENGRPRAIPSGLRAAFGLEGGVAGTEAKAGAGGVAAAARRR
ncbi:MAG TPA: thioesterase family protein [Myxococcota bacterium]|jgi:acyl-CoA thioester hydrolase|nr:thioesterase family protein [Myxococcota bacterium]